VLGVVVGRVEIGVEAVEDDDVEVEILLDQSDELGEPATVVAVIVLIGGWSNATGQ
jgi:hypothetical protein